MFPSELSRSTIDRLHALEDDVIRRRAAARLLRRLGFGGAVQLLQDLIDLARQGHAGAACVLPAFTRALDVERDHIPNVDALRRVASLQAWTDVELMLSEAAPALEYDGGAAAKADAQLFSQPLGYLKTKARLSRNPDEISRLAAVSNPEVIRNLLLNARLTEPLVIRICARRPARTEPLVEIWRNPKWSLRPAVRRALVFNPYFPPDVGVKIVPLLARPDLESVARDASLHAVVRRLAASLLSVRVGGAD